MRIGIYGGSFNPPHIAHEQIGKQLLKKDYLDKVIYVPVGDSYEKDLVAFKHRYAMLKCMIDNPNIKISNYENNDKVVYTYQTLDYFKSLYPNDLIYFICGTDNINKINTWKNYKYILDYYNILVVKRNGELKNINHPAIIDVIFEVESISSTEVRNNLETNKIDVRVKNYIKKHNLYS